MHFHGHRSPASAPGLTSPTIPPAPETTSAELTLLDPAAVRLRREDGRLQMHRDAWPPPDEEDTAALPAGGEADAQEAVKAAESGDEAGGDADETPGAAEPSEDAEWRPVILVRLFPLSDPDGWISVLAADGREVGVLLDVRSLAEESQGVVREELDRRYLVPEIRAILACRDKYDLIEWTVDTDRGRVTFLTRDIRESAKYPLPKRLVLTDVEGNRFDIPDVSLLDAESRLRLEERL